METTSKKLGGSTVLTKRSSSGQTQATTAWTSRGMIRSSQETELFPKGYPSPILSTACGSQFCTIYRGLISYLRLMLSCFEASFIDHIQILFKTNNAFENTHTIKRLPFWPWEAAGPGFSLFTMHFLMQRKASPVEKTSQSIVWRQLAYFRREMDTLGKVFSLWCRIRYLFLVLKWELTLNK